VYDTNVISLKKFKYSIFFSSFLGIGNWSFGRFLLLGKAKEELVVIFISQNTLHDLNRVVLVLFQDLAHLSFVDFSNTKNIADLVTKALEFSFIIIADD